MFNDTAYFGTDFVSHENDLFDHLSLKYQSVVADMRRSSGRFDARMRGSDPSPTMGLSFNSRWTVIKCNAISSKRLIESGALHEARRNPLFRFAAVEICEYATGVEFHVTGTLVLETQRSGETEIHGGCENFTIVVRGILNEETEESAE